MSRWLGPPLYFLFAILLGWFTWVVAQPEQSKPNVVQPQTPTISPEGLDRLFAQHERAHSLVPSEPIDDLTFARRLSLGMVGVVPSLEEIRWYEAQPVAQRRPAYLERLLADRRFAETLAERLVAAWMPARIGDNFVLYRPFRFQDWLAHAIHAGTPYRTIVHDMLARDGLWTDTPAVNFITAYAGDPEELAGQTTKNFLGLELSCAQCHDHPFAPWKQEQFRALAAHFGRIDLTFRGVDDSGEVFRFGKDDDHEGVLVAPHVPYGETTPPSNASLRRRLADWVTDRSNSRFREAIANRVWQMMMGRGLVEPVDDLTLPPAVDGVLPELARILADHDDDLRSLFRAVALSAPFARSSLLHPSASNDQSLPNNDGARDLAFTYYPLTRLSPADLARSLLQVSTLRTLDEHTGAIYRVIGFFEKRNFVQFFRTDADDESGTMSQRLMLMNDKLVQDRISSQLGSTAQRLTEQTADASHAVELAFLVCLTRRPTEAESKAFVEWIGDTLEQSDLEDLLWALVNSSEFILRH